MIHADVILKLEQPINEADARTVGTNYTSGADTGPYGRPGAYDWRVWNGAGFGRRLQSAIGNFGEGFATEITDMGQAVIVRISYHNLAAGKSASKTFCVIFDSPKNGNGRVLATSTKWRTIGNVEHAASYIRSVANSMASQVR